MKILTICLTTLTILPSLAHAGPSFNGSLGSAGSFAILAGSTVTNSGLTTITGNLGVWPGNAVTGFAPGIVVGGTIENDDAVALQAQSDLTAAYNSVAAQPCGTALTGQDLGGLILTPGVYCFTSAAQLTGTLTLDAQNDPTALFIFEIASTLITAGNSNVDLINAAQGENVFWQVATSATLGLGSSFEGNILASTSITLDTSATIGCGRALALNGAVTMDTNSVDTCGAENATPEPSTASLLLLIGVPASLLLSKPRPLARRLQPA